MEFEIKNLKSFRMGFPIDTMLALERTEKSEVVGDLMYYSAIIIVIVACLFIALLCVSMRTVAPSNVGYIDFLSLEIDPFGWLAHLSACLFVCLRSVFT